MGKPGDNSGEYKTIMRLQQKCAFFSVASLEIIVDWESPEIVTSVAACLRQPPECLRNLRLLQAYLG